MLRFLSVALAAGAARGAWPSPLTFGNALAAFSVCPASTVLLQHNLTANASYGLLNYFWTTGDVDDTVMIDIFMDGEAAPSISFTPAMACAHGFPSYEANDPISTGGLFSAGSKMGKAGAVAAWYLTYKMPFYSSVTVTARSLTSGCHTAWMNARGHEVGTESASGNIPISTGVSIPVGAKLQLQTLSGRFPPLSLVSMANVTFGYDGIMLLSAVSLTTSPPANNYIEGCWHVFTHGSDEFPGTVASSGFEDFYSSSFWFGAASGFPNGLLFAQPASGLLHFSRGAPSGPAGVEALSAYRFFDEEVFGFSNGGRLLWRVGDQNGKCTLNGTTNPIGTPSAVNLTSYAWLYTWPNGQPIAPLPVLPQIHMSYTCSASACIPVSDASGPYWDSDCDSACTAAPSPVPGPPAVVGCADASCEAFCDTKTVHGCAATWGGSLSMRTPPTGKGCGGALGVCMSPGDACAPGWALCLSNTSNPSLAAPAVRAALNASSCASGDPRRYVAAMQHADPAWSGLPPAPCPATPVDTDNGCSAVGWGAEPICCGAGCSVPSCPNYLWVDGTRIHIGENEGCGGLSSDYVDGVLCCKLSP